VTPDVDAADERELCRLILEAERLQMLIAGYLERVHAELVEAPTRRRAATAYTRAGGAV
jgi:hypothetical protein